MAERPAVITVPYGKLLTEITFTELLNWECRTIIHATGWPLGNVPASTRRTRGCDTVPFERNPSIAVDLGFLLNQSTNEIMG